MSEVDQIEVAVRKLSPQQQAEFRAWYAQFDAEQWDRQLEADAAAGRLDWLVDQALADRDAGRFSHSS